MARRIVAPATRKLDLTQGDYLIVKKRLNAGESRRIFSRMVKSMEPGRTQLDPMQVRRSKAVEYLVDWGTFLDASDKPIVIRGKSPDEIAAALDSLSMDDFNEVVAAVEKHDDEMDAEREQEKNATDGGSESSVTSPSQGA